MKTGALYIRVSTEEQTEYSPDAQKRALLDYAKKNKIFISSDYIFIDEGISGRIAEKRPGFMQMIKTAKQKPKPFDVILVHKFDRFSRSREDSVVYKSLLKKECGIKVISITEQLEDDKFSIILESMLEAMAEYYSLNLSDEVKKGMTEKAKKGGLQTGAAFGYEVKEKGLLKIVESESKIVKYIFDQYLNHNESFYRIAKKINEMGALTKRGNPFDNRGVEYILRNPLYIGKLRWTPTGRTKRNFNNKDTIVVDGQHDPIISIDIFESVQKKIKQREKIKTKKQRPLDECKHWLSGLIRCSNCNATLIYVSTKYPMFQCRGYTGGRCKVSHGITVKRIEHAVLNELEEIMKNREIESYNINTRNVNDIEIDSLKKRLEKIDTKLNRAKQAFLAEIDSIEEYKNNKKIILEEKEIIESKINTLKNNETQNNLDKFKEKINSVYTVLVSENIPLIEKQKSIRSLIEKIVYDKKNNTLKVYFLNI